MEKETHNTSLAGFFIRLYWMAIGNFITLLLAISIAVKDPKSFMLYSSLYLLNTICLIVSRYLDIRYLNGLTTENKPATMKHWKEYSVKLVIISLIIWIIVYFAKD